MNAAFNISANGWFLYEQTVGHSTSAVLSIGDPPLNQSSKKAVQLESSGGAR